MKACNAVVLKAWVSYTEAAIVLVLNPWIEKAIGVIKATILYTAGVGWARVGCC